MVPDFNEIARIAVCAAANRTGGSHLRSGCGSATAATKAGTSRRELAPRKQQRARVEHCTEKLAALERALLRERRDRIHDAERKRLKVTERLAALAGGEQERFRGEQEALWLTSQAAVTLLNTDIPAINAARIAGKTLVARLEAEPKECLR